MQVDWDADESRPEIGTIRMSNTFFYFFKNMLKHVREHVLHSESVSNWEHKHEPTALLRFVILATDGIWDVLSDKDSVRI